MKKVDKNKKRKRVAFEITPSSGQSYKELARRMRMFDIPDYSTLSDWLESLFDENGILQEKHVTWFDINQLQEMQVRDEKVDTAHAKALPFTLEPDLDDNGEPLSEENVVPLNTPGMGYSQSGNYFVPISLHRFWKAKNLGASYYPLILIPKEILDKVSMTSIHAMCRLDNSVIHQAKSSTLAQDAFSVLEVFRQRIEDNPLEKNAPSFEEITADKVVCKEKYPKYWELFSTLAKSASVTHGPTMIRNYIFKQTLKSGFKSFLNGKIDQVRSSLKKTHSPVIDEKGKEVGSKFFSKDRKSKFEITICEGGNQQEQNVLARISKKRVQEKIPIFGIICGTGASTEALIKRRIAFLELFLPLAVNQGFSVVEHLLRANYSDGFWKYPQFIQGLHKQFVKIGNTNYEITCPAEDEIEEWERVSVDSVISFLRKYHLANPKALDFEKYEKEIGKLVFPKDCEVVEVESEKKHLKQAA